jgi:predicted O-linked N-acetylglucosamine transferase (SPINDLY family)
MQSPHVHPTNYLVARALQAIVYCIILHLNRLGRITADMLAVWANILKRVSDSVLWLYKHPTMAVLGNG